MFRRSMSIFLIVVYTINYYEFKSSKTQAQALRGGNDFPTIPKGSYFFSPHLHKPLILIHGKELGKYCLGV